MHEMSLTESLVELIENEREKQGFSRVRTVRVAIGALGHVEADAVRFSVRPGASIAPRRCAWRTAWPPAPNAASTGCR